MIEESAGSDTFKQVSRGKLEALVALAETADCRRARLLRYFGENLPAGKCGNCDNCLSPPRMRDGKVIAQKLLSCAYRTGQRFGAMHLIDVLVGRMTDRVKQFGHDKLSVFAIGRELNERQWRAALRQLVAMGHLKADSEAFGALKLTDSARGVLRGETEVMLREQVPGARHRGSRTTSRRGDLAPIAAAADKSGHAALSARLRTWRSEVARQRGVPAYVVLHDSTLDGIAASHPRTLTELRGIPGIGDKKLEHYGEALLAVVQASREAREGEAAASSPLPAPPF
jgi:ATP-dependent DNA helicase RecQ